MEHFHFWVGTPNCYANMLDSLQKWGYETVGSSLAASLALLVHPRNIASLRLCQSYSQYQPPAPLLLLGDSLQSQILKRGVEGWGSEKKECLGGRKGSLHRYLPGGGLTMFLLKKDFVNETCFLGLNFQMSILACFSQITN